MRSYLRRGRLTCDHGFPLAGVLPSGEYLVCATVNTTHLQEHRALHLELAYVVIVRSPHNSSIPPINCFVDQQNGHDIGDV